MPLVFLITYVVISHIVFNKTKDDIKSFPLVLQMLGIIPFALLLVYIIYYGEVNLSNSELVGYAYSFYFLLISYLITYIIYFMKFIKILKSKKISVINIDNLSLKEKIINNLYLIVLIILSTIFFIYNDPFDLKGDDGLILILCLFFIFSGSFLLIKNKIFTLLK